MSKQILLGETREEGVVWFNKNPHAYPIGTKFYALLSDEIPTCKSCGTEVHMFGGDSETGYRCCNSGCENSKSVYWCCGAPPYVSINETKE